MEQWRDLLLRYEDLEARLADPSVYGDAEQLRRVTKELKDLEPVANACRTCQQALADREAAELLLDDAEMRELAREELLDAQARLEEGQETLKMLLLPRDPNDGRNVVMELRGGVGGEEGALFAASLLRMYTMYAQERAGGWTSCLSTRRSLAA